MIGSRCIALGIVAWALPAGFAAEQFPLWANSFESRDARDMRGVAAKGKLVFVGGTEQFDDAQNLDRGVIAAFDVKLGARVWTKEGDPATGNTGGASGESILAPLAVAKSVVVAGGGREVAGPDYEGAARAYDQATGTLLWSKKYPGANFTQVAAVGKRAFVATTLEVESANPSLFVAAYDLFTGDELWSATYGPVPEDPFLMAMAASKDHVALVGFQAGSGPGDTDVLVRVHDAKAGEFLWSDAYDAAGGSDRGFCAVIQGKRLYVGGTQVPEGGDSDGLVRAYKLNNGKVAWTQSLASSGSESVSMLRVHGGRLASVSFVDPSDYLVRAHKAKTGAVQWDRELDVNLSFVSSSFALTAKRCVVGTDNGVINLEAKTGTPVWDSPFIGFGAASLGSRVFVPGYGEVAAFPLE